MEIVFEKDISNLHILSMDTLFSMKFQIIFVLSLGFHSHVMQVPCEQQKFKFTFLGLLLVYARHVLFGRHLQKISD